MVSCDILENVTDLYFNVTLTSLESDSVTARHALADSKLLKNTCVCYFSSLKYKHHKLSHDRAYSATFTSADTIRSTVHAFDYANGCTVTWSSFMAICCCACDRSRSRQPCSLWDVTLMNLSSSHAGMFSVSWREQWQLVAPALVAAPFSRQSRVSQSRVRHSSPPGSHRLSSCWTSSKKIINQFKASKRMEIKRLLSLTSCPTKHLIKRISCLCCLPASFYWWVMTLVEWVNKLVLGYLYKDEVSARPKKSTSRIKQFWLSETSKRTVKSALFLWSSL